MIRRLALLAALVAIVPFLLPSAPVRGGAGIPTSISLVYPKKKIFKPGDWVFYRIFGRNQSGDSSLDYQRVQIGKTLNYRSEDCFWVETGWGPAPDSLHWSAALMSENLFLDSLADTRSNIYMRKLHMENDENGIPRAAEVRSLDPKHGLPDVDEFRPRYTEIGLDTVQTPKGPIVCHLIEMKRTYRSARDTADSTMQQMSETTSRRWMSIDRVPITGLVKEEERKVYSMRVWPVGRPSTEFPMREVGYDLTRTELIDFGHGAKPMISDRILDTRDPRTTAGAP